MLPSDLVSLVLDSILVDYHEVLSYFLVITNLLCSRAILGLSIRPRLLPRMLVITFGNLTNPTNVLKF